MKDLTIIIVTSIMMLLQSGCGLVGVVGTPTEHERKIPAEYDLAGHKNQKILVLVNQPGWLNAQANLRYYITDRINRTITQKVRIPSEYLVPYEQLAKFRSDQLDFSLLSPARVGAALKANVVLFVSIEDYRLTRVLDTDYYAGFLRAHSVLLDTATGEKLWPKLAKSKEVKVGFEVESGGQETAAARLADALAHCTARYFYNCTKAKFKIFDERSDATWQSWDKHKTLGGTQ